jgi:PAS domain S-box-containing protein
VLAQEDNLRVLIESSPTGIVVVDDDGKIKQVNSSTEKLFGYAREDLVERNVEDLVPNNVMAHHTTYVREFFKKPVARAMGAGRDLNGRRRDGTEFPVEIGLNPVKRNGKTGVLATVIDITDRVKVRESERMLLRELQHRTQNLFSVFQAIANKSLEEGKTTAEAKFLLNGRVQALAAAYKALASSGWTSVTLADVIEQQFAGFSTRMTITGCDVAIGPAAAQQFALIIHELATNALKYGALSTPGGHVYIEGKVERLNGGGAFSFAWRETGGPIILQPTRKGFGTVVLVDSVRELARGVEMNFDPKGLTYKLQFELSAIGIPAELAASQVHKTTADMRAT